MFKQVNNPLHTQTGLPDVFLNQKSQFGLIFEGLGMKNVAIFYGHLKISPRPLNSP
jgi:hypothetical protein